VASVPCRRPPCSPACLNSRVRTGSPDGDTAGLLGKTSMDDGWIGGQRSKISTSSLV
jgi:hypothetical protein